MGGFGWRPQYFLDNKGQSFGLYCPKKKYKETRELVQHQKIIREYIEFMLKVGNQLHFGIMKENEIIFKEEKAPSINPKKNLPTSSIYITNNFTNSVHQNKDKTKYILGLWLEDQLSRPKDSWSFCLPSLNKKIPLENGRVIIWNAQLPRGVLP